MNLFAPIRHFCPLLQPIGAYPHLHFRCPDSGSHKGVISSVVEGPYLMDMPLMGNVAAGYTSPVGLCMPPYPWKFIDGKSRGKLRKIFDQAQGNAINGGFGCHLPVTAMFLFAGFCLPAKVPEGGE